MTGNTQTHTQGGLTIKALYSLKGAQFITMPAGIDGTRRALMHGVQHGLCGRERGREREREFAFSVHHCLWWKEVSPGCRHTERVRKERERQDAYCRKLALIGPYTQIAFVVDSRNLNISTTMFNINMKNKKGKHNIDYNTISIR